MKRADLETKAAPDASAKQMAGAILCFLVGLLALLLSLTIESLVGLNHVHTELMSSAGVKIGIAAGLALVFCVQRQIGSGAADRQP
jgi:hypothetical protein